MAGQNRGPQIRRLAMAMPVGAQTVVTCSATNARLNPILAAAMYATTTPAPIANWSAGDAFGMPD
jgi:hypothetical protein